MIQFLQRFRLSTLDFPHSALFWLSTLVSWLSTLPVQADTYGLPPITEFSQEWKAERTGIKEAGVLVARSAKAWAELWKKHAPADDNPPEVDFERFMVVGMVAPVEERWAVYRIELDDPAKPTALCVRIAHDQALVQRPRESKIEGARLHLVRTPRSALPIRFSEDRMVDGALYRFNGGVEANALDTVAGGAAAPARPPVLYREQAEKLARAALGQDEIDPLKKKVWPGLFGDAYPQRWSVIQVRRLDKAWSVEYDGLVLLVDVETGQVSRPRK